MEAGRIYHVISRFVAKEWFVESAVERRMYLSLLSVALGGTDWRVFAFAIMSSHIHLGILAGSDRLADWMRPMHTTFANWLNARRDRIGAVFVKGPNVIDMRPDGAAHVINYIHNNPVRAGVVSHPSASDWTSHRAYSGLSHCPSWLDVGLGVELARMPTAADLTEWTVRAPTTRRTLVSYLTTPPSPEGRPPRGPGTYQLQPAGR